MLFVKYIYCSNHFKIIWEKYTCLKMYTTELGIYIWKKYSFTVQVAEMYEVRKGKSFYLTLMILRHTYFIPKVTKGPRLMWFLFIFITFRLVSVITFIILPLIHLTVNIRGKYIKKFQILSNPAPHLKFIMFDITHFFDQC